MGTFNQGLTIHFSLVSLVSYFKHYSSNVETHTVSIRSCITAPLEPPVGHWAHPLREYEYALQMVRYPLSLPFVFIVCLKSNLLRLAVKCNAAMLAHASRTDAPSSVFGSALIRHSSVGYGLLSAVKSFGGSGAECNPPHAQYFKMMCGNTRHLDNKKPISMHRQPTFNTWLGSGCLLCNEGKRCLNIGITAP